jgi:Methyl-accepting chemotaxis protein
VELARNEGLPLTGSIDKLVGDLSGERELVLDNNVKAIVQYITSTKKINLFATIFALVAGILAGFLLAGAIARPVKQVAAEAAKIADGDLTGREIPVKTRDEVGQLAGAFNTMQANLKEIANQLQEKSKIVASSSIELSASTENIAAGATETASTVSQVAGTVEQVTANVRHISDSSTQAAGYAGEGSAAIQRIAAQMEYIQNATAATAEVIHRLNHAAAKISQIVELITQIADQTNLLALNAAIEAARAGDQGRGFAVVAEEVRKLAEQSADAAKEIYALITAIQQESQKAVQSMDQGLEQVQAGQGVVKDVNVTFEKIIASVRGLAGDFRVVASAIAEISTSVQNVAAAAQEQTATMEEVSSTTQGLTRMAEELDNLAGRFKLA